MLFDKTILLMLISWCLIYQSCSPESNSGDTTSQPTGKLTLKYATGFEVSYFNGFKIVRVKKPFMNADEGLDYILVENEKLLPKHLSSKNTIPIPVKNIVCTSTTHIPMLDYLGETNKLVGFPTTDYISSGKMRARIDSGLVQDLGVDQEMNLELLADLSPEVVMAYTIGGDYSQFNKIAQLGIPIMINAEYLEEHPLGRAEWIKFMGALFNKEKMADSIFNVIEHNYTKLLALTAGLTSKPSCLSGVVYGDAWYAPGGQNYAAKLIADAGGHYLWESDSTRGFLTLSFEAVYEKAHQADYWIGVANFERLAAMRSEDARYSEFAAFKNKQVYSNDWKKGAKGGSEFLELGYLRPDIILADLIKILHPHLLPDHEIYFHIKLQ